MSLSAGLQSGLTSGLTVAGRTADRSLYRTRSAAEVEREFSDEEFFRFVYLPAVLASLVWDYVDTVLDLGTMLRVDELKGLSRVIRQLRDQFRQKRMKKILAFVGDMHGKGEQVKTCCALVQQEQDYGMRVEEAVKGTMKYHLSAIGKLITQADSELEGDWRDLAVAAAQAIVVSEGFLRYSEQVVNKEWIRRGCWTRLPQELNLLRISLPHYLGDLRDPEGKLINRLHKMGNELAGAIGKLKTTRIRDYEN
ncbi:MAG: hypothetical protein HDS14_08375 [Bacteroides sp.]|nr:hypothetical protein [Bacteroides sp.]